MKFTAEQQIDIIDEFVKTGRLQLEYQNPPISADGRVPVDVGHDPHEPAERVEAFGQGLTLGVHEDRGHARVPVRAHPVADHRFGAEEVRLEHELVRDPGGGLVAPPLQPERLDLLHEVCVPLAGVGVLVEVPTRRPHRTDLEGESPLPRRDEPREVVAEGHDAAGDDLETVEGAADGGRAAPESLEEGACTRR